MKVFTYTHARQHLAELLNTAREEEVLIKRRSGETFSLRYKVTSKSPFDVPGVQTRATTQDILDAVKESRSNSVDKRTAK